MSAAPRRAACATCLRPQSACICRWIAPVPVAAALLILQHPLEVQQAKGSGRLLQLCIPGSELLTGESFDPALLHAQLYAGGRQPLLLYPAEDGQAGATPVDAATLPVPATARLVLLDATWRKSRKMLHLNPLLAALPRLALRDMPASHYRIRKAHRPDQLSSFEAAAYALLGWQTAAENSNAAPLARLLAAFDGFVDQQAAYAPARQP